MDVECRCVSTEGNELYGVCVCVCVFNVRCMPLMSGKTWKCAHMYTPSNGRRHIMFMYIHEKMNMSALQLLEFPLKIKIKNKTNNFLFIFLLPHRVPRSM